jgi:beta-N-acetylhexosaminidase
MKFKIAFTQVFFFQLLLSSLCFSQALTWKLSPEQQNMVDKTFDSMSIEERVGQLLAPAIDTGNIKTGSESFQQVVEWIQGYHIGHIYTTSSQLNPEQVASLCNDFQLKSKIPLLIHSDLECGPGGRFDGATTFLPLIGLAHTRSEKLTYDMAAITAIEARAMGIHLINSPVLDVNINADNPVICIRSFGDDPELVATLGSTYMRGLQDNGLLGAAKHFPGHGDVSLDSHSELPVIYANRQRLDEVEFYPYKKAINAGLMAMMTAHISIPALDPTSNRPATLSRAIITDVLRKEFRYNGLIITDAFDMSAILNSGSFEETALQSVLAGNDIVLLWRNPRLNKVYNHFLRAIKENRISEARLNESVKRVLEAKFRLGLFQNKLVDVSEIQHKVGTREHLKKAREIQKKSIVLVKNEQDLVPLKGNLKITAISLNDDMNHLHIGETFLNEIKTRNAGTFDFYIDPASYERNHQLVLEKTKKVDIVIVGLFCRVFARRGSSSIQNENIKQFIHQLTTGLTPVIVVSFGSPYLIRQFPDVDVYAISSEPTWDFYGYDKFRPGQIAAAKALFGENDITGKLSVTIPDLYPYGHGIDIFVNNKNFVPENIR